MQVVLQGTSLNYEDATLLDKLEYALRVGGPAAERHLSQRGAMKDISVRQIRFLASFYHITLFDLRTYIYLGIDVKSKH